MENVSNKYAGAAHQLVGIYFLFSTKMVVYCTGLYLCYHFFTNISVRCTCVNIITMMATNVMVRCTNLNIILIAKDTGGLHLLTGLCLLTGAAHRNICSK